jgi:hypothetical protein
MQMKTDEEIGRIIGVAAVVAALPETASVESDRVKQIIAEMMRNFAGASDEMKAAANGIAAAILTKASIERSR